MTLEMWFFTVCDGWILDVKIEMFWGWLNKFSKIEDEIIVWMPNWICFLVYIDHNIRKKRKGQFEVQLYAEVS